MDGTLAPLLSTKIATSIQLSNKHHGEVKERRHCWYAVSACSSVNVFTNTIQAPVLVELQVQHVLRKLDSELQFSKRMTIAVAGAV